MNDERESLRRQLAEAEESLRLIRERMAEFVLSTDVPLQLVREERRLVERTAGLRGGIESCQGAALRRAQGAGGGADAAGEAWRERPFADRGCIRDPRRFFNRQRLVRELRGMLAAGNSVSLVGESQIGKSSLLYYLHATRAAWLPAGQTLYVDLQGVLDEADFCAEVLEGLGEAPGDLRALKWALRRRKVILLLDEVDKLADPAFSPRLQGVLRSLAQELTLTLGVASQRPLAQVFPPTSDTSPLHNIFTEKRVGSFAPEEARGLLARVNGSGATFTPDEIESLVAASGGHPARLQELASTLYAVKVGG